MVDWERLPPLGTAIGPARDDDRAAGVQPERRIVPRTEQALAEALRWADGSGLAVLPKGGGTKLDWGNPPRRGDLLVSTEALNRILDHPWADLTVTVEAGCPFGTLQRALGTHGQRLALDPLFPDRATIGGLLATNDSGTLRIRYGSLRDLVIGMTLALPDGTLARSGGRVVKNVAGYDLPKLATGALGTLGVITQATFRLYPVPQGQDTFSIPTPGIEEANRIVLTVHASTLPCTGLQIRFSKAAPPKLAVRFEGTERGLLAQAETLRRLVPGVVPAGEELWRAREGLFEEAGTVLKVSVLPTAIAGTVQEIAARGLSLEWQGVFQSTGLGLLRVAGETVGAFVESLRKAVEGRGGSVVVLRRGPGLVIEAWGNPGDSARLMGAVKAQFDPKGTVNPGRFVGGL
jgi:glycolate oxidase FAD binding subunit